MPSACMRIIVVLLVLCLCLLTDQVSKTIVRQQLASSQGISHLYGVFGLKYAENTGAFLSLGVGMTETVKFWLFTVLVAVVLLVLLVYLLTSSRIGKISLLCSSLIIGGGMSNLIDRLKYDGAVIDYLFISLGGMRSGIFNLADVMITIGLVGLLVLQGRRMLQTRRENGGD